MHGLIVERVVRVLPKAQREGDAVKLVDELLRRREGGPVDARARELRR